MSMSMPTTTNTSNTSTPSLTSDALNFREAQEGYVEVEAPSLENVDATREAGLEESDALLQGHIAQTEQINADTDADETQAADTLVTTGVSAIGVGAAIGATIGSIIPGIGTLIGGAVGALIGAVICLGCVIASLIVRPTPATKDYMAAGTDATNAVAAGADSANTLSNQSTTTADATLVENTPPVTTTTVSPT